MQHNTSHDPDNASDDLDPKPTKTGTSTDRSPALKPVGAAVDGPTDTSVDGLDHLSDPDVRRHPLDRFTPGQIVAALDLSGGIYSGAAKRLKCSPSTVANYVRRHADIRRAKERIENERLDMAEALLFRRMADDSQPLAQVKAAMYYLSAHGASRGYGLRAVVRANLGLAKNAQTNPKSVRSIFSFLSVEERCELEEMMAARRPGGLAVSEAEASSRPRQ